MFLSTSPTFMLVQNGLFGELEENGHVELVCQSTVQSNPFLCRESSRFPYYFRSWYDFSRTAASVLRLYMLEASGMRALYDPPFSAKNQNLASAIQNDVPPRELEMAHGYFYRAARFAAEFDRLFPHSLIEYQVKDVDVGETETISEHMYVIYFDEGIIYRIDAKMDVTFIRNRRIFGRKIHARVHVVVSKYDFQQPPNYQNQDKFKRFALVKELVDEWRLSQNPAKNSSSE